MTPDVIREYGKLGVSLVNSAVFIVAFVFAYKSGDQSNLSLMYGAVIGYFGAVVNYYIGSSADSAKKTDLLAKEARVDR